MNGNKQATIQHYCLALGPHCKIGDKTITKTELYPRFRREKLQNYDNLSTFRLILQTLAKQNQREIDKKN